MDLNKQMKQWASKNKQEILSKQQLVVSNPQFLWMPGKKANYLKGL